MNTNLESKDIDLGFKNTPKDVAEFNIRRKDGKYYDISQDSLVDQGITRLTDEQFLQLLASFLLEIVCILFLLFAFLFLQ